MGLLPVLADSPAGLVTTLAWSHQVKEATAASRPEGYDAAGEPSTPQAEATAGRPSYAFEGNILSSGATLVWLADVLGTSPAELIDLATATGPDEDPSRGVDLVPAFAGLGAPWWDDRAQAVMTGFTLGTTRADVARAGVESMALQIEDVLSAAEAGIGGRLAIVLVDGGPSDNDPLVQLLADVTQRRVRRPGVATLSSLGAAYLAGISAGSFTSDQVLGFDNGATDFLPRTDPDLAATRRDRWHRAVGVARTTSTTPSIKES
jgi:glycerol kinase